MPAMTTPVQLATELGIPAIEVRRYLHRDFPRSDAAKGQRWELGGRVADADRAHFRPRPAQ